MNQALGLEFVVSYDPASGLWVSKFSLKYLDPQIQVQEWTHTAQDKNRNWVIDEHAHQIGTHHPDIYHTLSATQWAAFYATVAHHQNNGDWILVTYQWPTKNGAPIVRDASGTLGQGADPLCLLKPLVGTAVSLNTGSDDADILDLVNV